MTARSPAQLPPGWRLERPVLAAAITGASAASLVLQLVAVRQLAPLVGSSLETWTAVIAVNLLGIALGSALGGRFAAHPRLRLALPTSLLVGAAAAAWVAALPLVWPSAGFGLPFAVRVPLLALLIALPAATSLSVPAPLAIAFTARHGRTGRAAGSIFALSTLGALAGNYLAGFSLIPLYRLDTIALGTAGVLIALAVCSLILRPPGQVGPPSDPVPAGGHWPFRRAAIIVFLASFTGLTLELVAARLIAQSLGATVYTWTGVIGVVLAGTAAGNWLGGRLADRGGNRTLRLAICLVLAAVAVGGVLVLAAVLSNLEPLTEWLAERGLALEVVIRSGVLFLMPATLLGTISPQVVRLTAGPVGMTAGRVYAASTAGALAGSILTGTLLIATLGAHTTLLGAAVLPTLAAFLAAPVWRHSLLLALTALVLGAALTGGFLLDSNSAAVVQETNYYTIRVQSDRTRPDTRVLLLDKLIHSHVDLTDPTFLHYKHEQTQLEFLRVAGPKPRALVIGGGGYTFPRAARTLLPDSQMDVVEIDPGVTAVAYRHLGLDPALGIRTFHADGRRFLAESCPPSTYNLITLDAVNDLAVPAHLLTRECADAARRALAPNGVYLVSVIDILVYGDLWPAVADTLSSVFPHVEVLQAFPDDLAWDRAVYVLYASDQPLDLDRLQAAQPAGAKLFTRRTAPQFVARRRAAAPPFILTDQYAPVEALLRPVYQNLDRLR